MALLFHHNMEIYGGAVIPRNSSFDTAYSAIGKKSNDEFIVAGFTEIVNDGKGIEFHNRAKSLDSKLTGSVLIDVGRMARSGRSEYVGIAWNPSMVTVEDAGQVVTLNDHTIKVVGMPANQFPNVGAINLPGLDVMSIKPDDRGLAWIKGSVNGYSPWIFAFMHNMYGNGERSNSFTNIKLMYQSLKDSFGKPVVYIGGDFNVNPRSPGAELHFAAASETDSNGKTLYLTTTNYTSAYDYWISSEKIQNHDVTRWDDARGPGLSDHYAVSLKI